MKIASELYYRLLDRKKEVDLEIVEIIRLREEAKEDGDLRENADYIKASGDLEHKYIEYNKLIKVLELGYPVAVTKDFNLIQVGSKFHVTTKLFMRQDIDNGNFNIDSYSVSSDSKGNVVIDNDIVIAGEIEDYVSEGYISTESDIGKTLMNKPLGSYKFVNEFGDTVEVVASKIW